MTSDQRDVIRFLRDEIKLTDREIGHAAGGIHEATIRRWRSSKMPGEPRCSDQIDDLRAMSGSC